MTPRERTNERIKEICANHDLEPHKIAWRCRREPFLRARRDVALYLREERRWTLPRIGAVLGRDHTTVIHMLKGYGNRA